MKKIRRLYTSLLNKFYLTLNQFKFFGIISIPFFFHFQKIIDLVYNFFSFVTDLVYNFRVMELPPIVAKKKRKIHKNHVCSSQATCSTQLRKSAWTSHLENGVQL